MCEEVTEMPFGSNPLDMSKTYLAAHRRWYFWPSLFGPAIIVDATTNENRLRPSISVHMRGVMITL
jgi:hypothetical protein